MAINLDKYSDEAVEKGLNAFYAYMGWKNQTQLQPEQSEVSLVCECHQFGGTLDTILVQGKRSLGDWKTASSVWPENLLQLSAYGHLWSVNYPDQPIEGGYHLLRFSKSDGDFTHHYWPNLDDAWKAFVHMRELYDLMAKLKERT